MHDCVIGMLGLGYEGCKLVTIHELIGHIAESRYHNEVRVPSYYVHDFDFFKVKVWQLKDYGDFRKSTNLTRFKHCPDCGKAIDWKEIRNMPDVDISEEI